LQKLGPTFGDITLRTLDFGLLNFKLFTMKKNIFIIFLTALISCNNDGKKEELKNPDSDWKPKKEIKTEVKIKQGDFILETTKYSNGQVKTEGNTMNGKREGKWTSFYENGGIWSETNFVNGKKEGSTITWYPNGQRRYEGYYKNDKSSGKWIYWDENGTVVNTANQN